MSKLSAGDRFLLDQIRTGDTGGWSQLVSRYQGRLLAYARPRFVNVADAEDVVQDTFLSFLRGISGFREQASLETYLFGILRRRIVDRIRVKGRRHDIAFCALGESNDDGEETRFDPMAADPTASWYIAKTEHDGQHTAALEQALSQLVLRLHEGLNFRDLMICEMVFYGQVRNKDIAKMLGMDQKQVALIKHRFIKRLQADVADMDLSALLDDEMPPGNLLTRVWEASRPSCPKRSTVGKYLLGTLDDDWQAYVAFHIEQLGCRLCQANRDDLNAEQESKDDRVFRERIFQSTVGFLKPADG